MEQHNNDLDYIVKCIREDVEENIRVFSIDSLMKIKVTDNALKQAEKLSFISSTLSKLCQELGIILFLIVQVSNQDLRTGFMGIKGSGDIEYDADYMFFLTIDKKDSQLRNIVCKKDRYLGRRWESFLPHSQVSLARSEIETVYVDSKIDGDMPKII